MIFPKGLCCNIQYLRECDVLFFDVASLKLHIVWSADSNIFKKLLQNFQEPRIFRKCYSNWRFCKRKMQFKAQQWLKLCTSLIFYVQTFQLLQKCSSKFSWFVIFEKLVFELHLEGWAFVYSILAPVLLNKLKNKYLKLLASLLVYSCRFILESCSRRLWPSVFP